MGRASRLVPILASLLACVADGACAYNWDAYVPRDASDADDIVSGPTDALDAPDAPRPLDAPAERDVGQPPPPPSNDTRAGATVLDFSSPALGVTADTTNARRDSAGLCACSNGPDVFYRFTLAQAEIVYADTAGASFATALYLQDAAGTNVTDPALDGGAVCSNHGGLGCSDRVASMIAARLGAGTWYLVVSGCAAGTTPLHVQHLPVGNGPVAHLALTDGATTQAAGTTTGAGLLAGACCSDGPENTYWFVTCPLFVSRALVAATCGSAAFASSLEQRSAARAPVATCNQGGCGGQALLSTTLPDGAGLHALYVDGCAGSGAYTVRVTLGACATGTLCNGACVNTATDAANCGACGVACPGAPNADPACVASTCTARCLARFADCNGTMADGCETPLTAVTDCGACGRTCSSSHCTPLCPDAVCAMRCDPGWADCDGMPANGCEVDLTSDRLDCGACGARCTGSRVCVAGRCM